MRTRHLLLLLLTAFSFASCQKEFDPTGEWQESYAVYCLLNLKDSVQYVRVNKVFLSKDDPGNHFQQPDSVNANPDLIQVSLITLLDGAPDGEPAIFIPTDEYPKDSGLFATQDYFVFKCTQLLQGDRTYRLMVRNLQTGFEMKAETGLLGNRPLSYSYNETRYYNINQYSPEVIDYSGSLITSQFIKRVHRLLYYEYRGEEMTMKYVDWRTPYMEFKYGPRGDTAQVPDDLFKYWAENIPVDPFVRRKAVGMDKMLIINDDLISLYIGYYNNLTSGQYLPDMTNFDHGTGIFASRYNYTFFAMRLRPETIDSLAYGRFTKDLGFADAFGNWPPLK